MRSSWQVAWKQLSHSKVKLIVATAGVVVAVLLMLVQLGFLNAAYDSSLAVPKRVTADLVVLSPQSPTFATPTQFARRMLYRLPAHPAVAEVQAIYLGTGRWKNPWDKSERQILVYGLGAGENMLQIPGYDDAVDQLQQPDVGLFDRRSRPTFGPVADALSKGERVDVEVNRRKITIAACTEIGVTLGVDGNLFVSDTNFLRLFPRIPGSIDLGLVRLKPGVDPAAARDELVRWCGTDMRILTKAEFIAFEKHFLDTGAPINFIFGLGTAVGFFIGFVIVYQILYTEVSTHLPQFATLKAIGFTDNYLLRLVMQESLILAVLGYLPGTVLSWCVYQIAARETKLPMALTMFRLTSVLGLTITMCIFSAAMAMRKLRAADPADIF
ncbi:MAG: ABC transporter permease DevC [Schlesneria sp.]